MRTFGSIALAVVATLLGLLGTLMLGLSGLSLAGPGFTVIDYSDSDDGERAIGIGMGVFALVAWLSLTFLAGYAGLGGEGPTRARRVAVWIVLGLSSVLVMGALVAVLATPPPHSEYPLPEWGRA